MLIQRHFISLQKRTTLKWLPLLLEYNADPDKPRSDSSHSALYRFTENNHPEVVALLLKNTADP